LKIKQPIFLNCFSRSGSNILWNVFLSHPEVCSPIRETLQIFGAGLRHASPEGYITAILSNQPRLFDQWNLAERKPVSASAQGFIDRTFYRWVKKTLTDPEMKFKSETEIYTEAEVISCRMAAKNNNGLVFLSEILGKMYPGVVFFNLVRHPYALYDGHKRHKIFHDPGKFAQFYSAVIKKMICDTENRPRCHLVRFEDLLQNPTASMQDLYSKADLDFDHGRKVRLKAKPYLHADGTRRSDHKTGSHYWMEIKQLEQFLEADINQHQTSRLSESEKEIIKSRTGSVMERLGYK
jgi:hypothetical protein